MERTASFGYWLRRRRKALDLTQEVLALRVGCATITIRKIESDELRPSSQVAERLATCLGLEEADRPAFLKAARAELAVDRLPLATTPAQSTWHPDVRPAGTVTFLFTDIEGSTRMWEQHPEAMRVALARHDAIIRHAVIAHNGTVVKTTGDGIHAAFTTAPQALAAALAAQRGLSEEAWGATGLLRVRMALHSGVAEAREGDYFGPALNRAARLLAAGHGGQILVSLATQTLIRDYLLPAVELRDLGERRLKDLIRPEQIFQVVSPDLPANFPPLRTLDARPNNVPAQPTSFIGREHDMVAVRNLLRRTDVRLITLTGTGGTGKTRLALQVAAELLDEYAHGIFFVALAPISDPDLIVTTIAQVLGIKEVGGQSPLASLKEYLRDRQMLLVLDNFEQIVIAAPLVAELLEVARNLNILVTSRMRLSLYGEREFAVPPLIFPHQSRLPSLEHVMRYEAVRLFVERAQTVEVEFVITAENAQAVVEICSRLDGLPLAIELAAARSKILSPQAILARLDRRFKLLTGGARNLPPRQQTLRSAIDWSFDLLNLEEQKLFARLGVFVGGCTIEAVEAVCAMPNGQEIDVFDGLISLVDKSLLRRQDGAEGEPRFVMLETIREYAHDRLAEQGEAAALRSRHATHYLAIAEQAEPKIHGTQQIAALEQLEAEHDNLRAALAWFLEDAAEMGVRLAGSLWWFWYYHGHYSEGLRWLAQAMTKTAPLGTTQPRAKVYIGAAMLAYYRGDLTQAKIFCETGMEMAQAVGDRWYAALALNTLGTILRTHRDYAAAEVLYEQGLSLARDIGDEWLAALALGNLGILAFHQDDCRRAAVYCSDSVARFRAVHDYWYTAGMLNILARVMESTNDDRQAAMLHLESLALFRDLGNQWGIALCLAGLAGVAGAQGQPERAARLLGAAEALWEAIGEPLFPTIRADHDRIVASVHAALSAEVFVALWAQGRNMPIKQAIAYAVAANV